MDRMIAVFWRARQLADSEKMKKMEISTYLFHKTDDKIECKAI